MSESSLEIYRTHRLEQTENGTFSEEFEIVGGLKFWGIFDNAHSEGMTDSGKVIQRPNQKRILVNKIPETLVLKVSQIVRIVNGQIYLYAKKGYDDEGVPVLWLS